MENLVSGIKEVSNPNLKYMDYVGRMGKFGIYADSGCARCYGRGWIGKVQGKRVPCHCLIKVNHQREREKLEKMLQGDLNE